MKIERKRLLTHILYPSVRLNKSKLNEAIQTNTILITGASSGIGEQLVYMLADYDVHLIVVGRNMEKLLEIKETLRQKQADITVFQADLRVPSEVEPILKYIHEQSGALHRFVNNAGISIHRTIEQSLQRHHDFTRTMSIHYFAPLQILLSTLPLLSKCQGQIINTSTINTLLPPFADWAAYQASKSAIDVWMRSASAELDKMGISISTLYLGLVRTPMILPTKAYEKYPAMPAREAAKLICKMMYTKKRSYRPWWTGFARVGAGFLKYIQRWRG